MLRSCFLTGLGSIIRTQRSSVGPGVIVMKYLDYAAMGATSSAYAEASRAQAGVNELWTEIQRLSDDINSLKYEREFQKWAEELIYQFNKNVTAISTAPACSHIP